MIRGIGTCGMVVLAALLPAMAEGQSAQWFNESGAVELAAPDRELALTLDQTIQRGRHNVEQFFAAPFPSAFVVKIFPNRAALDQYWRVTWHQPDLQSACWMVASGIASELDILSPHVWNTQACEHDPADATALQRLITHELVHVYHGQHNADQELAHMDDMAWFVEGLATYASGQLDADRLERARAELIKLGHAPALDTFWTGPNRYGMSGSMVRYIDETFGRKTLIQMLAASNQDDLLSMIDLYDDELLENWRRWMLHLTPG